jgi:hypothetical protein
MSQRNTLPLPSYVLEDGDSRFPRDICKYLSNYRTSHPRKQNLQLLSLIHYGAAMEIEISTQ